jgi:16S rRNA C967 or C1407 C5-methylase (RsmB/RsmF family)
VSKKPSREKLFEEHFEGLYKERWSSLRAGLLELDIKTELKNPFGKPYHDYRLDPASLYPVKALAGERGMSFADFCASPGGKTLASVFAVHGEGDWYVNDLSPARVARLKAVLHDCLPPAVLARVRVSTGDASRWGMKFPGQFDRVLVDAPCSGERHLLAKPEELARWSLKGVKGLQVRQHALLCAALDSAKSGGRVVYSTCSIHPLENDGVIAKLMKSREGLFRVLAVHEELGEPTEHGWILLPDRAGCGPIYFSVLEKV